MSWLSSVRGLFLQTAISGGVALCALLIALAMAGRLGVVELGVFAGWLAWSLILWPLATLRIETRVSLCESEADLATVFSATCTAALGFLIPAFFVAILLMLALHESWLLFFVPVTAVGYALLDLCVNTLSFRGEMRRSLLVRSVRQIAPFCGAFVATFFSPHGGAAFLGYGVASIMLAALVIPFVGGCRPSLHELKKVLGKYRGGLKASLLLGCFNAVWLNGFIPFLNYFGMSALAGQYSVVQRVISAPLAILTAVVNAYMVKADNRLHLQSRLIFLSGVALFALALIWAVLVYWGINLQSFYPVPHEWRVSPLLYVGICFFTISSFAVGTLALVAVRLRDEWFLSAWQVVLVVLGALVLFSARSLEGLLAYLVGGGLAYWLLLFRWVWLARRLCRG